MKRLIFISLNKEIQIYFRKCFQSVRTCNYNNKSRLIDVYCHLREHYQITFSQLRILKQYPYPIYKHSLCCKAEINTVPKTNKTTICNNSLTKLSRENTCYLYIFHCKQKINGTGSIQLMAV